MGLAEETVVVTNHYCYCAVIVGLLRWCLSNVIHKKKKKNDYDYDYDSPRVRNCYNSTQSARLLYPART